MSKLVEGTNSYFAVTGERLRFEYDEKSGTSRPTGETLPKATRFEAISVHDAEDFATRVYKREGLVCEIHEIYRSGSKASPDIAAEG
jgi:hypothetical protein